MIPRLATALVLLLILLGSLLYLPAILFLLLLEVFLLLAGFELIKILQRYGLKSYPLTLPLTLALPWIWVYEPTFALNFLAASALACTFQSIFFTRDLRSGLPSAAGNFLIIFYLGLPFAMALLLSQEELLWVLFVVWGGDIAAYLVGRRWGRHRITPAISPGKSLEGFLAGLLAAAATSLLAGVYLRPEWPLLILAPAGALVGLAGIFGDLFESLMKRGAGVKDSSRILPGHGGILDRIDSLLLAIPAYFLFSSLIE